jgi:biopolymer transport protein ExbD
MNTSHPLLALDAEPDLMMDINTTPLIDVMLVLLIMLIITIPLQLHSINLDLPAESAAAPSEQTIIQIRVDAQNAIHWNDKLVGDWNELDTLLNAAATRQASEATQVALPTQTASTTQTAQTSAPRLATAAVQPELHIRADATAKYEAVAHVLASAQRHGLNKLNIVGTEQFSAQP